MKKYFLFILFFLTFFPISSWAIDAGCDKKDYLCYKDYWVREFCRGSSSSQSWDINKWIGSVTELYRALDVNEQKKQIQELIGSEPNPNERAKIEKELSLDRIGNFSGFKTVEIARIVYRTNMNRIFSCAVIASRIERTQKVKKIISQVWSSNIGEKLDKDIKKLEWLKSSNCGAQWGAKGLTNYPLALAHSATVEYCNYTNYLDYLQENVSTDYTRVIMIEKGYVPVEWLSWTSATILSVSTDMNTRSTQIGNDLERASSTLRKALVAYREMERTYAVHLMLLIIYDDYLELRQNLNSYLNTVSQIFEKAKNAQSANR